MAQQQEQLEQQGGIVTTQKIGSSIRSHGIGGGDAVTDFNEVEGDIATPDCENV